MAELTDERCCTTELHASCCEPGEKAECCGHGEGCRCGAGSRSDSVDAPPSAGTTTELREEVRRRYASAATQA
jgi:hypothetical protein